MVNNLKPKYDAYSTYSVRYFYISGIYVFYFMEMIFNLIGREAAFQSDHGHSHNIDFDSLEMGANKVCLVYILQYLLNKRM